MSAWPGGPCPDCGDDMPANLVRCATCRALLNPELKPADIMPYQPVRLQEVDSFVEADLVGYFVGCPRCRRKLRVHGKYDGQKVACRFCQRNLPVCSLPGRSDVAGRVVHLSAL